MKPDEMERDDVLKGVLRNYGRFYMRKAFLQYPFIRGDKLKRRYMLGCLKAFAKTTATKKFYDLERLKVRASVPRWTSGSTRARCSAASRSPRSRPSGPNWEPT